MGYNPVLQIQMFQLGVGHLHTLHVRHLTTILFAPIVHTPIHDTQERAVSKLLLDNLCKNETALDYKRCGGDPCPCLQLSPPGGSGWTLIPSPHLLVSYILILFE